MPIQIDIRGDIVPNEYAEIYEWFGMDYASPGKIRQALNDAAGDEVEFIINSGGGDVFSGSEIYSMIKAYNGKTVSKIYGLAASAASFAAIGANKVMISPTGQMMIHNASGGEWGDKRAHRDMADALSSIDNSIANAYELKTGKGRTELLNMMGRETWMDAKAAVDNGFADEILFDEGRLRAVASARCSSLPMAVIQKAKNELMKMKGEQTNMDNLNNQAPAQAPATAPVAPAAPQAQAPAAPVAQAAPVAPTATAANAADFAAQERARLQAIDAIAANIDPQLVNEAKYGVNPMTAEQLAYTAMTTGKMLNQGILNQAIQANIESNVNKVGADPQQQQNEAEIDISTVSGVNKVLNALTWASQSGRPRSI